MLCRSDVDYAFLFVQCRQQPSPLVFLTLDAVWDED